MFKENQHASNANTSKTDLRELGDCLDQVCRGCKMTDKASISWLILLAPFTVREPFSRASKIWLSESKQKMWDFWSHIRNNYSVVETIQVQNTKEYMIEYIRFSNWQNHPNSSGIESEKLNFTSLSLASSAA